MAADIYASRMSDKLSTGFTSKNRDGQMATVKLSMSSGVCIGDGVNGKPDIGQMLNTAETRLKKAKLEKKFEGMDPELRKQIEDAQAFLREHGFR